MVLLGKYPPASVGDIKRFSFDLWVWKTTGRRVWQPTPVFLLGESHGQKSLAGTVHRDTKRRIQLKPLSSSTHGYPNE